MGEPETRPEADPEIQPATEPVDGSVPEPVAGPVTGPVAGPVPGGAVPEEETPPATLLWSLRLLAVLVVFGGLVVLAMVWRHDDLLRAWAEGNSSAQHILRTGGLDAIKNAGEGEVSAPHFIAPAVTLYAVMVLLLWVLGRFYRNGFEWGRASITALLLLTAVCSIGGLMTDPPTLFVVCTLIAIVIGVAAVVCMWLPATTRYIHPREKPHAHG